MNPDNPTFRTPEEAARAKEYVRLTEENARLRAALEQIADPRKRDHREPDAYTQLGCVMHIAEKALEGESR